MGQIKRLRESLGIIPDEKRLVVVFAHMTGAADGVAVLQSDWLPWVIVNPQPQTGTGDARLLHEIGHACRLAHQEPNASLSTARNLMFNVDAPGACHLWAWQVNTIYNSYWCNGRKPIDWWVKVPKPEGHPFMWEEPP